MRVLCAVETSFDETGIALCDSAGLMRASLLSSQVELHAPYGGCVPELAARTHLSDLPQLWRHIEDHVAGPYEVILATETPGHGPVPAGLAHGAHIRFDSPA